MTWTISSTKKECRTWYKIYGDLKSGIRPLVVLHGGPGMTSDVLTPFSTLTAQRSIPVILYDQIGNGRTTHFPDKKGDTNFWVEQLFLDELKGLLNHLGIYKNYDLLGNSWGGKLAARHAARQPGGLNRLIIMSSPASQDLWIEAQKLCLKKLPQEVQDTVNRCEKEGKTDSEEYKDAIKVHCAHFLCRVDPMPEPLKKSFEAFEKDPTVYSTMNGASEFSITGSMKNWSMLEEAHKISVPTLLVNGAWDEAADICVYPYFKLIPRVKWVQFAESSHMAHLEEPERFFEIVGDFLEQKA